MNNISYAFRRVLGPALVIALVACGADSDSADESSALTMVDSTFGNGGIVETEFDAPPNDRNRRTDLRRLFALPDGRIVAFGVQGQWLNRPALARYLPDGTLDTSFGSGGRAQPQFPFNFRFTGAALQSDGTILLVGSGPRDTAIAKLTADGSLDPTFGQAGVADVSVCDRDTFVCQDKASAVEVLSSGKFLVLSDLDRRLIQFNADGSRDTSFGVNGIAFHDEKRTPMSPLYPGDQSLRVQSDGRILVLESEGLDIQTLRRWNADGTPDGSFGTGGRVVLSTFNPEPQRRTVHGEFHSVAVRSDGSIVLAGSQESSIVYARSIVVVRLKADGTRDSSFGVDGFATTGLLGRSDGWRVGDGNEDDAPTLRVVARATADDGNGGVVVVADADKPKQGSLNQPEPGNDERDILVVRYGADGKLDTSFGAGGLYRRSVRNDDMARDIVALPGNRLLVGATATVSRGGGFAGDGINDHDATSRFALVQLKIQ